VSTLRQHVARTCRLTSCRQTTRRMNRSSSRCWPPVRARRPVWRLPTGTRRPSLRTRVRRRRRRPRYSSCARMSSTAGSICGGSRAVVGDALGSGVRADSRPHLPRPTAPGRPVLRARAESTQQECGTERAGALRANRNLHIFSRLQRCTEKRGWACTTEQECRPRGMLRRSNAAGVLLRALGRTRPTARRALRASILTPQCAGARARPSEIEPRPDPAARCRSARSL